MINELYDLSQAIERAGISPKSWHRKFKPIPNIRPKTPCVRIQISDGKVVELSEVKPELGAYLRKYGSNQGSYPCMNLAPLYRITEDSIKKSLSSLRPEELDAAKIEEIRAWCKENNWGKKFQDKYKISMKNTPAEMAAMAPGYRPLSILIDESNFFLEPNTLHQELEREAFRMLTARENVALALYVLFHAGDPKKKAEDDYGTLSVALESSKLIEMGVPAVSHRFVDELNDALLEADTLLSQSSAAEEVDAFGRPFAPTDDPMPEVKLAGGFTTSLRTMYDANKCQARYGRTKNDGYPLSFQMRKELQAALSWISSKANRDQTWISTDKNEILFVYPLQLPSVPICCTRSFKCPPKDTASFPEQSKRFLEELQHGKEPGTDPRAERLRLFILRKIDNGRTKVIYTRQTDACELERCCELWTLGCTNLPAFSFGQPQVLFPLDTADILNRFWKQDGELATSKFRPFPQYHGLELLMEVDSPVNADLHAMAEKAMTLGAFLGSTLAVSFPSRLPILDRAKEMLALMGLLLYREGIRKENYMEQLPYLYGQLLKASDELHALYCNVVRDGDLPTQLAGSSLYQSAAEAPFRTLSVLGQRMNPYLTWAKTYRTKNIQEKGKESWKAAWLLSLCEGIAGQLHASWKTTTRFNDEEKAQLFIGYLAAFPKKEKLEETTNSENQ